MTTRHYVTGGGVVINDRGEVLLIERHVRREEGLRHEVRLPKGHVDPGETIEQAAVREVCEETGYCEVDIVAPLGEETVEFDHRGDHVTRTEHYFLMRLRRDVQTATELEDEEALFKTRWAKDFDEAVRLLTYPSEQRFVARAQGLQI